MMKDFLELWPAGLGAGLVAIGMWLVYYRGVAVGRQLGRRAERDRIARRHLAEQEPALWTWCPPAGDRKS